MEKVYQLLHGFLFLTFGNILIYLSVLTLGKYGENTNDLSLNTLSILFSKNTIPNFYFTQTNCL